MPRDAAGSRRTPASRAAGRDEDVVWLEHPGEPAEERGALAVGPGDAARRLRQALFGVPDDVGLQQVAMVSHLQFAIHHEMLRRADTMKASSISPRSGRIPRPRSRFPRSGEPRRADLARLAVDRDPPAVIRRDRRRAAAAMPRPPRPRTTLAGASKVSGSCGQSPAIVSRNSARSGMLRAIGPCTDSGDNRLFAVPRVTRPGDGRSAHHASNRFRADAGCRPWSVPCASHTSPVASATAPPPVEPPQVSAVFHGLRVRPNTSLNVRAAGAELRRVRLGDDDAALAFDALHHRMRPRRHVITEDRRAIGRAHAGDVGQILDGDRQAGEPTRLDFGTAPWPSINRFACSRARSRQSVGSALTAGSTSAMRAAAASISSSGETSRRRRRRQPRSQ